MKDAGMSATPMTEQRAGEIALMLVKYSAARREFALNPNDDESGWIKKKSEKIGGVSFEKMREYALTIILPVALHKHFGQMVQITSPTQNLSAAEIREISLKLVREEGMEMPFNNMISRLGRIEKETDVSVSELKEFYIRFVLPVMVAKIAGWPACKIEKRDQMTF